MRYRRLGPGRHRFAVKVRGRHKTVFRWRVLGRTAPAPSPAPSPGSAPVELGPGASLPTFADATSITASPALYPGYSPEVTDYVTRCSGSDPVLVSVHTDRDTEVTVDGQGPRRGRFEQAVPLQPGQAFSFATNGPSGQKTHYVRCLPSDFPKWTFARSATPTPEWFVITPLGAKPQNYVIFFDRNGVPAWWYKASPPAIDAKVLSAGNVAFATYYGGEYATNPASHYEVRALDGSLVRSLSSVGTPTGQQDLQEAGNGNYLLSSYKPRDGVDLSPYGGPASATVLDAEVQEITPAGELVWSWNSKDHIALSETDRWWPNVIFTARMLPDGRTAYDHVHLNAVEIAGDSILLSFRHTDAVYRIDRATGAVRWKLGGTTRPESLTPIGDPNPNRPTGGQHDVRLLPDGSISVHDNGTNLDRPPRVARYTIDTAAKTATLSESITDPLVTSSFCCGSARKLAGGNWLIQWGSRPIVTELAADGTRIFNLTLNEGLDFSYRAFPVPLGQISRQALRDGMTAQHPR